MKGSQPWRQVAEPSTRAIKLVASKESLDGRDVRRVPLSILLRILRDFNAFKRRDE